MVSDIKLEDNVVSMEDTPIRQLNIKARRVLVQDPCQSIRDQIADIEGEIKSCQNNPREAPDRGDPVIKPDGGRIISLRNSLGKKKQELKSCMKANFSAIIIYHNDWKGVVQNTQAVFENRGYPVYLTDDGQKGLTMLQDASKNLKAGARMVIYLAGHGGEQRKKGDMAMAPALKHWIEFNNGSLTVGQMAPLFEALAKKGVHLTVVDGSCNGGETVYNAIGQTYCAVATTGLYSPSLTNFPDPSNAMKQDGNPSTFGLWWDDPHLTGSWLNGAIVSGVPERLPQRLYRNDKGEFSRLSLFIRPSVAHLTIWDWGGWTLHYSYCYLYRFIYKDQFDELTQEEKNKFTNDTQSFIASIHATVDPQTKFIVNLNGYLDNQDVMAIAAKEYAKGYSRAWQTLANDPVWDPSVNPKKYVNKMYGLSPADYLGETGFLSMVKELKNTILLQQAGFAEQEDLLRKIDAIIKEISQISPKAVSLPKLQSIPFVPHPENFKMHFDEFEREAVKKFKAMDMQLKIDRIDLMHFSRTRTFRSMAASDLSLAEKEDTMNAITKSMAPYKELFKAVDLLSNKIVISDADANKVILAGMKEKLVDLISDFKGISPVLSSQQGRASFLMALIEDAVAKVQSGGGNPGDVIYY
jgi:hypothetical protein